MQLGGPSGGCIPARLADTPIDYDALAKTGAEPSRAKLVELDAVLRRLMNRNNDIKTVILP